MHLFFLLFSRQMVDTTTDVWYETFASWDSPSKGEICYAEVRTLAYTRKGATRTFK